jgi:cysteine-rich repeat protein
MGRVAFKSVAIVLLVASVLCGVASQCLPDNCPKRPPRCPRTWNYPGAASWGSQCPDWLKCSTGLEQSPLNIIPPAKLPTCRDAFLDIRYRHANGVTLFNTGNYFTAPVSKQDGNTFTYQGVNYILRQMTFHSPSEHAINGKRFDLEIQFIHDSATRPLITSVFFQRSGNTTNPFLEQLVYDLPQFSDCACGNGRLESTGLPAVGVNELCDEGLRNTNSSAPNAGCCRLNCLPSRCGDGIIDQGEACDDGLKNGDTPGTCRTTCCLPACGDGVVDPGEECDDKNRLNLDNCSSICKKECGDAELNLRNEQCDNGANNSNTVANACRLNCVTAHCGDGVVDNGEQCDNGTFLGINPSQCRSLCLNPRCGDGYTDVSEDCDDGDGFNGPTFACSETCKSNCGDGVLQDGEECDDGAGSNLDSPDATCRSNCKRPRCGDGIIDPARGEQCDSTYMLIPLNNATNVANWWCDANCQQRCGSGLNDSALKLCDHGCYNDDLPNRCRKNCMNPICGDGIVDVTEQCDDGLILNSNSVPNACRVNCTRARCGDGVIDSGETCDDNNLVSGDGCDSLCRKECGNGNLEASAGEQCDLGANNADVADVCRTNCQLPRCGDRIVDSCEECDDGLLNSATNPNACRLDCTKPYCGDGIVDTRYGEKCDLGALNSDVTPDGCSSFCIPNYCRQRRVRSAFIDLTTSVPTDRTAFDYSGSWSRPPCAENVNRLIFSQAQTMSDRQYAAFAALPYGLPGSARPIQAQNNRQVRRPCLPALAVCGNGVLDAGEGCDKGLLNSDYAANACRRSCRLAGCGDGVTDAGEECDDGRTGSTRCSNTCKLIPRLTNPYICKPWTYSKTCAWSSLCSLYPLCAGDRNNAIQSPIDVVTSKVQGVGRPTFSLPAYSYSTSNIDFVNTGRQLGLVIGAGNTFDGLTLRRIEFHSPSEHTVNGVHSDLEVTLLHSNADDSAWIGVALLFNKGTTASPFLSQFDFYVPKLSSCGFNNGVVENYLSEECDDGPSKNSDFRPDTCRTNGKRPSCGDGVVDRGEQCDNGANNQVAANSCKPATCLLPYCGDGFVDAGEQCDPPSASCSKTCQKLCGNGILETGEDCDNGILNSDIAPNACRTNCRVARCGDGVIDNGEACDGNDCRANCVLPSCGDGVVDVAYGEECDDGTANNGNSFWCLSNCKRSCGTGTLPPGTVKQCDAGVLNGNVDGAPCRTDCSLPRCGDGVLDVSKGEECDLGTSNGLNVDGAIFCSVTCKILCGNGAVDPGEECDNGALNDDTKSGSCRTNCKNPYCGDGVRDVNEQCDFGSANGDISGSPCRSSCVLPQFGDGVVDPEEDCDDRNLINGDGCSATGRFECGNGRRDGVEQCDNGAENARLPNSCRPQGYKVGSQDLSCTNPFCGDGIIDDGEQCDDGANNGNGVNRCRTNCRLPYCGDGIIDDQYGEVCDDGLLTANPNNDWKLAGCSVTCQPNACRLCHGPTFSLANIFDRTSPVATYSGSLSEPPCPETVKWYVFTKPGSISAAQYAIFSAALLPGGNTRGVQPLNKRTVAWTATAGATCGNCVVEGTEECDQGDNNANVPDKCRVNCVKPKCGDGILDSGEACDNGALNSPTGACTTQCKVNRVCPASCTGPSCSGCQAANTVTATSYTSSCAAETVSGSGTVVNVAFASILAGAGCNGPTCGA